MKHERQTPSGVTGPLRHRNDVPVPSGWRKATPATLHADLLAEAGTALAIEKGRAMIAVKRVGAHIGLKAADLLLLDTLSAFSKAQDWQAGQRPIVWASNAYLTEQTGFSLSALKRHARRLADTGVITFKDSPNGKRWGHRDAAGTIVEAYGFDLSPLAARAEEFEALAAQIAAQRALCQQLKRQITVARRMIRARLEMATRTAITGPWHTLTHLFEDLLSKLPKRQEPTARLEQVLAWFKNLAGRVEAAYLAAQAQPHPVENCAKTSTPTDQITQELDPREAKQDPHIQTTNKLQSVICMGLEKRNPPLQTDRDGQGDTVHRADRPQTQHSTALDLATVVQACPEFASWAHTMGGHLRDWGDVHRAAGQLRPMIGITDPAWALAQQKLGPQGAAAALVLVFDKHCTGEVTSPGGYLRGMISKAKTGELHLARSFYGRLNGHAA